MNRAVSSTASLYETKLLAIGATKNIASEAQKSLIALGYKNSKLLGVYNTDESDQELIATLKEKQWDAIAIGMFNSFDYCLFLGSN